MQEEFDAEPPGFHQNSAGKKPAYHKCIKKQLQVSIRSVFEISKKWVEPKKTTNTLGSSWLKQHETMLLTAITVICARINKPKQVQNVTNLKSKPQNEEGHNLQAQILILVHVCIIVHKHNTHIRSSMVCSIWEESLRACRCISLKLCNDQMGVAAYVSRPCYHSLLQNQHKLATTNKTASMGSNHLAMYSSQWQRRENILIYTKGAGQ